MVLKEKHNKLGGDSKKSRTKYTVIIALSVMFIVIAVLIALLVLRKPPVDDESSPISHLGGRGTVVTEENARDILDELQKPIDDASYTCSMSMEWTFESWDTPSKDAYVENDSSNSRTVYFDVYLDDEDGNAIIDELIYSSPYIPVEAELSGFALQKEVPSGRHTATVVYYLVDDDANVLTDVSVGIRLYINN